MPATASEGGVGRKRILAFCHIEKAAGTSLTHILRRVFFLRYADVRPMHSRDSYYLTSRDLKTLRAINPFLQAIGGHSVVPHGSLVTRAAELAFITQLRDPLARAVSHFRYWVTQEIDTSGPESFLQHPLSSNFQVKKLAGCEDLELAKQNLRKYFLLAGTVERFDDFLVLLAGHLDIPPECFTYSRRNVNPAPDRLHVSDDFVERLRSRNELDQQLYDWVSRELVPEHIARYRGDFAADLARFKKVQAGVQEGCVKPLLDFAYRRAWLNPLSGLIRVTNGLPYRGSYSIN